MAIQTIAWPLLVGIPLIADERKFALGGLAASCALTLARAGPCYGALEIATLVLPNGWRPAAGSALACHPCRMSAALTYDDVLAALTAVLGVPIFDEDAQASFPEGGGPFSGLLFNRCEVEPHLASIGSSIGEHSDRVYLADSTSIELLIQADPRLRPFGRREEAVRMEDLQGQLTYELGNVSMPLALWLLCKITAGGGAVEIRRSVWMGARRDPEQGERTDLEIFLETIFRRFAAITVRSGRARAPDELIGAANAALFQIAYSTSVPFAFITDLTHAFGSVRRGRPRRGSMADLEAPKLRYNEDIVQHYLRALASPDLAGGFLAYYHVAEHYFTQLLNEELTSRIRSVITAPGFSVRRDEDVRKVAKVVSNTVKAQNDDRVTFDERRALYLTIKRFVDVDELHSDVEAHDESLVEYYRAGAVEFSGGKAVDLGLNDQDRVCKALSSRIYDTRNAIVHAKEGDARRYRGRVDDDALAREHLLLRFVAERILIGTADVA